MEAGAWPQEQNSCNPSSGPPPKSSLDILAGSRGLRLEWKLGPGLKNRIAAIPVALHQNFSRYLGWELRFEAKMGPGAWPQEQNSCNPSGSPPKLL